MCAPVENSAPEWVHGILLDHPNLLPVSSILKQGPSIDMMWYDWEDEATGVKNKRSMLQLAAATQAFKCLQLLLEAGADARLASPSDGKTALHLACACRPSMASARVIAMLVQYGADRDALDFGGNKPGHSLERMSAWSPVASSVAASESASDAGASDVSGASYAHSSECQTERHNSMQSCNHCHHSRLAPSKHALVTDIAELELKDGVDYGSAHFRMFHYKVDTCPHEDCIHDTEMCPYLHPGDKSRRRNPGTFLYQPVPCPHFRKGNCRLGDTCPLSHGVFECWLHPSKYRTQLCTEGNNCERELCFFAHSLDELREPFDDCDVCPISVCQAASTASLTPRSVCRTGHAGTHSGLSSVTTSPNTSQGSISSFSMHDITGMDKKMATLQATAIERERTRRDMAVAAIAETLKTMAVSRNATFQYQQNHQYHSLYKSTAMQDATSVLSIPNSDSSMSLTLGSSEAMECHSAFA